MQSSYNGVFSRIVDRSWRKSLDRIGVVWMILLGISQFITVLMTFILAQIEGVTSRDGRAQDLRCIEPRDKDTGDLFRIFRISLSVSSLDNTIRSAPITPSSLAPSTPVMVICVLACRERSGKFLLIN